jgi:glycosyltransferase involved in cell wall biosynthesis
MIVGVCDYPSAYAFPPTGYGSIERWLWSAAVGARDWGAKVHLIGPQWRAGLPAGFGRSDVRLEGITPDQVVGSGLDLMGLDLLIVGHAYPTLPAWRAVRDRLGCDVATFQHEPAFPHAPGTFDDTNVRLYCYSREMMGRFAEHRPRQALSVQIGLDEEPLPARAGTDLVWLGRVCAEKAPHLAALAAARLGRRLRIIGPVHEPEYVRQHAGVLDAPHVTWVGEVGGAAKAEALRDAAVLVYTCSRDYVEAGAAVFGDALRAGTPVAALVWRPGSCPEAALCDRTGAVTLADPAVSDEQAVEQLAAAIQRAAAPDPEEVQRIGLDRFDPFRHFTALAGLP